MVGWVDVAGVDFVFESVGRVDSFLYQKAVRQGAKPQTALQARQVLSNAASRLFDKEKAHLAQWQSTPLVRERSRVRFPEWAPVLRAIV
jgi:hypothetical protein